MGCDCSTGPWRCLWITRSVSNRCAIIRRLEEPGGRSLCPRTSVGLACVSPVRWRARWICGAASTRVTRSCSGSTHTRRAASRRVRAVTGSRGGCVALREESRSDRRGGQCGAPSSAPSRSPGVPLRTVRSSGHGGIGLSSSNNRRPPETRTIGHDPLCARHGRLSG